MPDLSIETRRLTVENAAGAATLLLPRFDPALGTLLGARIRLDGVVTASLSVENMEARATPLAVTLPAWLTLQLPSGATLASAGSNASVPLTITSLAAFDGTADFDGASGTRLTGLTTSFSNTDSSFDEATLSALVGTGDAELSLIGNLWLRATAGANARLLSDGDLAAAITLEYGYVPASTPVGNSGDWGFSSIFTTDLTTYSFATLTHSPPVQITTATQRFVFADRTTGWHDGFNVAQFDPARGTLQSVEIRLIGNIAGGAAVENHGEAATASISQSAALALAWADGTPTPLTAKADLNWNAALGAADGIDDFAGPGGWTSPGQAATGQATLLLKDQTDLARFLGTSTLALGLDSTGSGYLSGTTADLLAQLQARGGAQVEVRYTYLPADPTHFTVHAGESAVINDLISASPVVITVEGDGKLELRGRLEAPTVEIASAGAINLGPLPAVPATGVFLTGTFLGYTPVGTETPAWPVGVHQDITLIPNPNCRVVDTRTNTEITVAPAVYAGPVAGLDRELIRITAENLNVTPGTDNWFIRTGDGTDAIAAHGGTNVLDGGGGSNFLTGAAGQDTFFLDARTGTDDIWSTIVAFGTGDAVTIWGLAEAGTTLSWIDGQGAATATGLTLHTSAANRPTMSVTLAGYTSADLSNGHLATSFGTVGGTDYLYIRAT